MLRESGEARRALQQKYRWLFVDEFQDTDPIQAEIFLMLASEEAVGGATVVRSSPIPDPESLIPGAYLAPLRPGALFVVGDPKQSIFRFRRADIDIYNRVGAAHRRDGRGSPFAYRQLPLAARGCATWRTPCSRRSSAPRLRRTRRRSKRSIPSGQSPMPSQGRAWRRCRSAKTTRTPRSSAEAALIASYIQAEVAARRRAYGDFLVLTRQKPRLARLCRGLRRPRHSRRR